jgi:predicted dithiol-disulfide oxidoreductase (DUF899 family)
MAADEFQKMINEPPDWLVEWAEAVGTDLATGLAEGPGWNAFALSDGLVYHTYSRHAPDGDILEPYCYQLLDQVPKGRSDEVRATRHDEYEHRRVSIVAHRLRGTGPPGACPTGRAQG